MRQQSDAVCGFGHANTCATGTPLLKCISRLPWVCHRSDALPCEFVSLVVWLLIVCMAHAAHDTQSCGTNIMITQSNVCVCLSFLVLYTCSSPFLLLCVCGRTGVWCVCAPRRKLKWREIVASIEKIGSAALTHRSRFRYGAATPRLALTMSYDAACICCQYIFRNNSHFIHPHLSPQFSIRAALPVPNMKIYCFEYFRTKSSGFLWRNFRLRTLHMPTLIG